MCADAGFSDIRTSVVQPVHRGVEPGKAMALSTLMNISDAILAEGLATPGDLADTIADLEAFTADPESVISLPRVFQVWGRHSPAPA